MPRSTVVADAGPIHYLVLIDCADLLEKLFAHVLIPFAVRDELLHPNAPQKVKDWLVRAKPWFEISSVPEARPIRGLHRGETEALQLATRSRAAAILMDDFDGRTAAKSLQLRVVGTIAVLELAAERDFIDLPSEISKLRRTNFFCPQELLEAALERDRERRKLKHLQSESS